MELKISAHCDGVVKFYVQPKQAVKEGTLLYEINKK